MKTKATHREHTVSVALRDMTRGEAMALLNALDAYAKSSMVGADVMQAVKSAYQADGLTDLICEP